jgi:hypothetical protein
VDVVGRIGEAGGGRVDLGGACEMARHPESRLARRILR